MKRKYAAVLMGCAFATALLGGSVTQAAEPACPFAGQKPMLQVQMFFGLDRDGRQIAPDEWQKFLETAATPRFPGGFTVYDGQGQWLDVETHTLTREKSKILQVQGIDSAEIRKAVEDISRIYRETFHQKAVGIVSSQSCAAFY